MLITCRCLNLSVDGRDDKNVDVSSLNLAADEESENFFKEKLKEIIIKKVTVQVKSLVRSKTVGDWTIEFCLNCSTSCYSTRSDGSQVLANASLISNPDIVEKMKSYKDYSPVFRIIVEPLVLEKSFNSSDLGQSRQKIQTVLSSLQQQMNETVREQVTKTEELIRLYTEQQYKLLEEFRERAARDHKALSRRVYEAEPRLESDVAVPGDGETNGESMGIPCNKKLNSRKKTELYAQESLPVTRGASNLVSRNSNATTNSLDSEGLFVLEGMEDSVVNEPGHSEGDSDTDHDDSGSHDEGIDVHRKRLPSFHMAKSLPVNVPVYSMPSTMDFENDEEIRGTVDIAASIKALARSVHGDAIFGDLPRPRFSTQI